MIAKELDYYVDIEKGHADHRAKKEIRDIYIIQFYSIVSFDNNNFQFNKLGRTQGLDTQMKEV